MVKWGQNSALQSVNKYLLNPSCVPEKTMMKIQRQERVWQVQGTISCSVFTGSELQTVSTPEMKLKGLILKDCI